MKQEINSKRSWKNVPKIISTIPNDKNKLIMYSSFYVLNRSNGIIFVVNNINITVFRYSNI